jgi:ribosome-binding factor A
MAALSTVVLSAIRSVFIPDLEFEAIQHADKVISISHIFKNSRFSSLL